MLLARLAAFAATPNLRRVALAYPPAFSPRQKRALLDAALIAGLPDPVLLPAHACVASCYAVKRPAEATRRVAFVDVGQRYTSAAVYEFAPRAPPVHVDSAGLELGAGDMDGALWDLLAAQLPATERASRGGGRLLAECVKAKRTLSTVALATIELECFGPEEKDFRLSVTRERFEAACAPLRARLDAFLRATLTPPFAAVEVTGGGVRVPWAAATIAAAADGAPLSRMLDGACATALGAAFVVQASPEERVLAAPVVAPAPEDAPALLPPGLAPETIAVFAAAEAAMAAADAEQAQLADAWNALEAFILETRGVASSDPALQPAQSLPLLAAAEEWMMDARDSGEPTPLAAVTARLTDLEAQLRALAPQFYAQRAAARAAMEAELAAASAARLAEAALEGKEDRDARPLRKAERLRLATANKEEGTVLFKDGNLQPAVGRWTRALEHLGKFIPGDLTPEDEPEINALKVALHLNIAMALLRDAKPGPAAEAATAALALEPANAKALYRRATALSNLKRHAEAKADAEAALALEPSDRAVASLLAAANAALAAEKTKEKAIFGKMFS